MRSIFLLVPSLSPTGPVKGAVALANALAAERAVSLISLKGGPGVNAPLDPSVKVLSLADATSWPQRVVAYRKLLADAGGRDSVASISFCLSADVTNLFCRRFATTCASVRGNLVRNYRMDYGLAGTALAMGHLQTMRGFDHVVAMTDAMAAQVAFYSGRSPEIIGNFVDESSLESYRVAVKPDRPLRLVFVGSLTHRKQPLLLVQVVAELRARGHDARLDVIGDGPLHSAVGTEISRRGLRGAVMLHGQMVSPFPLVARADVMVLPSLSEGLSRAALEALYLGVPCVLRAVDGNADVIRPGVNGALFFKDAELTEKVIEVAAWAQRPERSRGSLLPDTCRQAFAAKRYLTLVEQQR